MGGRRRRLRPGHRGGGHQGTHRDDPATDGTGIGLLSLVAQVREAVRLPIVAAGGLDARRPDRRRTGRGRGAPRSSAPPSSSAPSRAPTPLHKQAMTDPLFTRTELTRAFSGRPARGLVNRFMREHGRTPRPRTQVHHLTSGLRKAAAKVGDPQGMALWAGQGHRMARDLPAGQLVEVLADELEAARASLTLGNAS